MIIVRITVLELAVYICVCNGITDTQVRRCAREGACSLSDLQMELGVACQCGTCASAAVAILHEESGACGGRNFPLAA